MKTADIAVTYQGSYGSDLTVVNAARVSFDKASDWEYESAEDWVTEKNPVLSPPDTRLINYLAKHKHFSPFNHTFLSFRIKAPIFVARQLVKHKFLPWNEVSRRYVDSEPEFYMPDHWRAKADNVKQGSAEGRAEAMYIVANKGEWCEQPAPDDFVKWQIKEALQMYQMMLKAGVCAEQARMMLPLNTMTEWIWSGTLGAFADMLRLRLDPHTQYESRIVAQLIHAEVEKLFPVSIKALLNGE